MSTRPRQPIKRSLVGKTIRPKTLCLTMIVKNEAKNMKRLLESLKSIIDFISIVDTGSSDNTRQVIADWGKKNNIPTTVHREAWKNFGYNRTHSVQMAQQTYPKADYLLLSDADFVWELGRPAHNGGELDFDKRFLSHDSYMVFQYSPTMKYKNVRLLKTSEKWECIGVTHEFWRVVPVKGKEVTQSTITTLTIKDIGDGGCKADKFERDERLLREGLIDPSTPDDIKTRYKFYLAQTLKEMGKIEESVSMYRNRIDDVGWYEELYISWCRMGECLETIAWERKWLLEHWEDEGAEIQETKKRWNPRDLDKEAFSQEVGKAFAEAHLAYQEGTKTLPTRAECLARLAKMLRSLGRNKEAFDVALEGNKIPYPKRDSLFVEPACYDYLFDHELSIVSFYIDGQQKIGRDACVRILEHPDLPSEYYSQAERNIGFYV